MDLSGGKYIFQVTGHTYKGANSTGKGFPSFVGELILKEFAPIREQILYE